MELETFSYSAASGWSNPPCTSLDSDRTLVLVFGASSYRNHPAPIEALIESFPRSTVVGCSTSGEILGDEVHDESLSVAVVRFADTNLRVTCTEVTEATESESAGEKIARDLLADDLRGVLVLSDGLSVNGTELVRGLGSVVPPHVTITGGLAGDGDRFESTWVVAGGAPQGGRVVAVGLYGERIRIGHGSKGGWDIFGPERLVTKSERNVLYELDDKPALELYKSYLGERASDLPAAALLFPLAIRTDDDDGEPLVRTILAVDEETQSMTFAGDIVQGSRAQLMKANFDRLVDGAHDAATLSCPEGCEEPVLSIAISCVGRRLVLGERSEDELESALEVLPALTQQVGFYSYGELSPRRSGPCVLHNQTMTLTTLCEA